MKNDLRMIKRNIDSAEGWVDMPVNLNSPRLVSGNPRPRINLLRTQGARTKMQRVSLLSLEPSVFYYEFRGDEAWHVIKGSLTITLLDTGETLYMEAGDVVSVPAGHDSKWEVHEPFMKFVVNTSDEVATIDLS